MNSFEKAVINSALSAYSSIKNISSSEITTLQNKVNNLSDYQANIFDITSYDIANSSATLTYDFVNSKIVNNTGGNLTVVTKETSLKNLVIKSFKILTNDSILTDFKIEYCVLFGNSPIWTEIGKNELNLNIFDNTQLKFRITIPPAKELLKIYMIYEN